MKKFFKIVVCSLLISLLAIPLTACGQTQTESFNNVSYLSLRINPEIELIVDEEGTVVGANAVNPDGEVILSEIELVGDSVEDASEEFVDKSAELGYLDVDGEDETVYVDAEGESEEDSVKLTERVAKKINKYFENKGIFGKVSQDTLDKYADNATLWNVSIGQAKIIMSVLDNYPLMTEQEVLALSVSERIALLKDTKTSNGLTAEIKAEFRTKVEELKTKYADMFTLKDEIKALEESLNSTELTEDEIASINQEIDAKKESFNTLETAFKKELQALKDEYKVMATEYKEEHKKTSRERKENYKGKIDLHENNISSEPNSQERIRDWRKGKNCL